MINIYKCIRSYVATCWYRIYKFTEHDYSWQGSMCEYPSIESLVGETVCKYWVYPALSFEFGEARLCSLISLLPTPGRASLKCVFVVCVVTCGYLYGNPFTPMESVLGQYALYSVLWNTCMSLYRGISVGAKWTESVYTLAQSVCVCISMCTTQVHSTVVCDWKSTFKTSSKFSIVKAMTVVYFTGVTVTPRQIAKPYAYRMHVHVHNHTHTCTYNSSTGVLTYTMHIGTCRTHLYYLYMYITSYYTHTCRLQYGSAGEDTSAPARLCCAVW